MSRVYLYTRHVQKPQSAIRVAENFINTYGKPKFLRLIELFKSNEPGPKIADEFAVSRQRVHQWKTQLGVEKVQYVLDPKVEKLLSPAPRHSNTRTTV